LYVNGFDNHIFGCRRLFGTDLAGLLFYAFNSNIYRRRQPMSKGVAVVVDSTKVVDNQNLVEIGRRMKSARESVGLSRPAFATKYGCSVRTLENNEAGRNEPGVGIVLSFYSLGINANWLLTGEGPMLLADLAAPAPAAAPKPEPPRINVDALAHAYAVTLQTAPKGETLAQTARKAVAFYQYCFDQGLITEDGEGKGNLEGAA
jgi:transcriptional regulator with XRE-family HTH domain